MKNNFLTGVQVSRPSGLPIMRTDGFGSKISKIHSEGVFFHMQCGKKVH